MNRHQLPKFEELKSLRQPIRNVNLEHEEKLTELEKIAKLATERVGTMGFFIAILVWTVGWIGWNSLAPQAMRFDPFPAFVLWLFISNMIQILLLPLIMVGQNLQGKHSEARAQADFEVNIAAEREIETILKYLENHDEVLQEIHSFMEKQKEFDKNKC